MGIEPTYPAWKAGVLPLNYTRISYKVCPEPESNQRHEDFQSSALPTELSGQIALAYVSLMRCNIDNSTQSQSICQDVFSFFLTFSILRLIGIFLSQFIRHHAPVSPLRGKIPCVGKNMRSDHKSAQSGIIRVSAEENPVPHV